MTKTRDEVVDMWQKIFYKTPPHHNDVWSLPEILGLCYDSIAGVIPQWRDIKDAPRDGTTILLCTTEVQDGHMQTAYWDEKPGLEFKRDWAWHHTDADIWWHKDMFTHWKPLPTPPHNPAGGET